MEYLSHTGNKIIIAHFPGNSKKLNKDLIEEMKERKFNLPENIEIISSITKDQIENSPLNYQLNNNNYNYINPLSDINVSYKPYNKIKYILNGLKKSAKEYSLILDGNDVIILEDLDNITDVLNYYNKKIIYNATIWLYPHMIVDIVENRGQYGKYCYLNAGCCIGKTKDLLNFYEYTYGIFMNDFKKIVDSEQYYIRKAFNDIQDKVFFDYDCKAFQCWHKKEVIG